MSVVLETQSDPFHDNTVVLWGPASETFCSFHVNVERIYSDSVANLKKLSKCAVEVLH